MSRDDRLVLGLMLVAYQVLSEISHYLFADPNSALVWWALTTVGISATFVATLLVPSTLTVGLLAYVIAVTGYACSGSLRGGLAFAALSLVCATIADQTAPARFHQPSFTLPMFAIALIAIVVTVENLTRERRRTVANLDRLYQAIRAVTATPALAATLESVVDSVSEAVGAAAVGILLREDDHLYMAGPDTAETRTWTSDQIARYTRRELATGDGSPLARAVTRAETVVVPDTDRDKRFPEWSAQWARSMRDFGYRSLVVVPMRLGGDVIGVLNACFTTQGAVLKDEIGLLEAYAEQASLVIVRAQAYEREKAAAEQLAETDRLKSEFLAMVSHELRTPLTAVKGFVDTVLLHWDRFDDDRRRDLLARASGNADELARLIGQLLDFSRIDANRVELSPQVCVVHELVTRVAEDLAPVLASHNVTTQIDDAIAVVVDSDAFSHVLINLLSNAVKFSPKGSQITVTAHVEGHEVVVSVQDEGVGIEPEEQERIFERFYQSAAPALSRRGTGIGLAIVRRFVDLHGGTVWVESTPRVGSTFSFTLPAAERLDRPDDTNNPDRTDRGEQAAAS